MTGIECTRQIRQLLLGLPVVMFTAQADRENFLSSMVAGASGYLVKSSSPAEAVAAVGKAMNGLPAFCVQAEKIIVEWPMVFAMGRSPGN